MTSVINNSQDQHTIPELSFDTNFKDYFIRYDCLYNLSNDVVISMFNKYRCYSGCKICYLDEFWVDEAKMAQYIRPMTPEIETRLTTIMNWFDIITTCDDMYFIKCNHPSLYAFYERHSDKMWHAGVTDIGFIQQQNIIDSLGFTGVYELSFSDIFLNKKNGDFAHEIVRRLTISHQHNPIGKIKIIISQPKGDESKGVQIVVNWARQNNIIVGSHFDFTKPCSNTTANGVDYKDQTHTVINNIPVCILSELIYIQGTDIYLTMIDSTIEQSVPYYNIMEEGHDDPSVLVYKTLQAKITEYAANTKLLAFAPNQNFKEYFKYVSTNVIVHPDYNFIPLIVFRPYMKIYKELLRYGWVSTPHGLYKPPVNDTNPKIIPLFSFVS